jgi:chromosome segregation ATPase
MPAHIDREKNKELLEKRQSLTSELEEFRRKLSDDETSFEDSKHIRNRIDILADELHTVNKQIFENERKQHEGTMEEMNKIEEQQSAAEQRSPTKLLKQINSRYKVLTEEYREYSTKARERSEEKKALRELREKVQAAKKEGVELASETVDAVNQLL